MQFIYYAEKLICASFFFKLNYFSEDGFGVKQYEFGVLFVVLDFKQLSVDLYVLHLWNKQFILYHCTSASV